MDLESLKERLRKMKALADFGYGGERDAAERLITEICAKHGISIDEIEADVEREHTVSVKNAWQRKIFRSRVVDRERRRRPDHRDHAFRNHHAVERRARLPLGLARPRDYRRLRRVEAGDYSAGNRHEEAREKRIRLLVVGEASAVVEDRRTPHRRDDKSAEDRERPDDEQCAEERIDPSDNGIDREKSRRDVVREDEAYRPPEDRDVRKPLPVDERRWDVGEDRNAQEKREHHDPGKDDCISGAKMLAHHLRKVCAVHAHRYHAGEEIVHRAHQHASDRNYE